MSRSDKLQRIKAALARKALQAAPAAKVEEAEEVLMASLSSKPDVEGRRTQAAWVVKLFPAHIPLFYCPSLADLNVKPILCGFCRGNLLVEHLRMVEERGINLVPEGPGNTQGYGLQVIPLEPAAGLFCPHCAAIDKSSFVRSMNPTPKWLWVEDMSGMQFVAPFALLCAIKGKDEDALRSHSRRVAVGLKPKQP